MIINIKLRCGKEAMAVLVPAYAEWRRMSVSDSTIGGGMSENPDAVARIPNVLSPTKYVRQYVSLKG